MKVTTTGLKASLVNGVITLDDNGIPLSINYSKEAFYGETISRTISIGKWPIIFIVEDIFNEDEGTDRFKSFTNTHIPISPVIFKRLIEMGHIGSDVKIYGCSMETDLELLASEIPDCRMLPGDTLTTLDTDDGLVINVDYADGVPSGKYLVKGIHDEAEAFTDVIFNVANTEILSGVAEIGNFWRRAITLYSRGMLSYRYVDFPEYVVSMVYGSRELLIINDNCEVVASSLMPHFICGYDVKATVSYLLADMEADVTGDYYASIGGRDPRAARLTGQSVGFDLMHSDAFNCIVTNEVTVQDSRNIPIQHDTRNRESHTVWLKDCIPAILFESDLWEYDTERYHMDVRLESYQASIITYRELMGKYPSWRYKEYPMVWVMAGMFNKSPYVSVNNSTKVVMLPDAKYGFNIKDIVANWSDCEQITL